MKPGSSLTLLEGASSLVRNRGRSSAAGRVQYRDTGDIGPWSSSLNCCSLSSAIAVARLSKPLLEVYFERSSETYFARMDEVWIHLELGEPIQSELVESPNGYILYREHIAGDCTNWPDSGFGVSSLVAVPLAWDIIRP